MYVSKDYSITFDVSKVIFSSLISASFSTDLAMC